ncbi:MAG TPA: hypothetical protein VE397_19485 [Stellaceae bacterium]|nr:hypothetical protein [Stellaceae bacterium]
MYTQSTFAEAVLLKGCNQEPALDDMLADPIIRLLMGSDRVAAADVRRTLAAVKQRELVG